MRQDKKITVIASDFDGTILRPGEQQVREAFFPLIRALKEQGIAFVAASGRQYANLKWLMKPIEKEISFISENGALVASRGRVIYKSAIDKELVRELILDMKQIPETEILVSTPDTYYGVPNRSSFIKFLQEHMHVVVAQRESYDEIEEDILKVSIWWEKGIPADRERQFHEKYDGRLQVVDGGNGWLDFNNLHTSKGAAIAILAEKEGFSLEETVSFGDSENDMEMLRKTGISYVMSTAKEHVKQAGMYVCEDVLQVMQSWLK